MAGIALYGNLQDLQPKWKGYGLVQNSTDDLDFFSLRRKDDSLEFGRYHVVSDEHYAGLGSIILQTGQDSNPKTVLQRIEIGIKEALQDIPDATLFVHGDYNAIIELIGKEGYDRIVGENIRAIRRGLVADRYGYFDRHKAARMGLIGTSKLVKMVGISQPTLSAVERGERGLTIRSLYKVADILKVDISTLMGYLPLPRSLNEKPTE